MSEMVIAPGARVAFTVPQPVRFAVDVPETQRVNFLPVSGPAGQNGQQGLPGAPASTFDGTALEEAISGQTIVRFDASRGYVVADWADPECVTADLFITLGAIEQYANGQSLTFGYFAEFSWSWASGPLYLAANGIMTQSPPTAEDGAVLLRQVATAITPASVFFNPQPAIALSD